MAQDRLYVDKEQDEFIKSISEDIRHYNFKEGTNTSNFLLAASKGYDLYDKATKIDRRGGGFVRAEYINMEDMAYIYAHYLYKIGKMEDLVNRDILFDFEEKCAYKGFLLLKNEVENSPLENFEKKKILQLNQQYERIKGVFI